jgi:hypothetical protein
MFEQAIRDNPKFAEASRFFCVDFKPGLMNLRAEVHEKSAVKLRDFQIACS